MQALFAYLNQFAAYGTADELYDLIDPACLVAPLSQHETCIYAYCWMPTMSSENAPAVLATLDLA